MSGSHVLRSAASLPLVVLSLAQPVAAQSAAGPTDALRLLGLSVATSGGPRDTLGLLVASVTRDGPADQAGITTGNRILSVNGLATRVGPDELGRRTAADSAISRFVRAVQVAPARGEVTLKVSGGGATRTVALPLRGEPDGPGTSTPSARPQDAPPAQTSGANPTPPPRPVPAAAPPAVTAAVPTQVVIAVPASTPVSQPTPTATPTVVPVDSTTTRATPQAAPTAAVSSVVPGMSTVSAPAAVAASASTRSAPQADLTLPRIADVLGQVQIELRRVAREASSLAMSDSLAELEWQLSEIRRRVRAISGVTAPAAPDSSATRVDSTSMLARWLRAADRIDARTMVKPSPTSTSAAPASVAPVVATPSAGAPPAIAPGIELAKVSGDLAAYLGSQAESALVIVKATEAYEPLKAGDVILQADGTSPDLERLRTALVAHARVSLTLLRRGRVFTVLVGDATH